MNSIGSRWVECAKSFKYQFPVRRLKMDELDRLLKKYENDGFQFQPKETEWGKRYLGTKKPGDSASISGFLAKTLGVPHKVYVGHFESGNPAADQFQLFLSDAERFFKDANTNNIVDTIVVVTPQKFDKKPMNYLLEHSDRRVVELLEFKVLGGRKEVEPSTPPSSPTPPVTAPVASATSVPSLLLDIASLQSSLPSPSEKEHVLYAWEVFPEKAIGPGQAIFVATQERGLLMRRVGTDHITAVQFKWESLHGDPRVEVDSGGPSFHIFDGATDHRLRHKDAEFIGSMIHHLRWAREGFVLGHMQDLGFDSELVARCAPDVAAHRYQEAVRSAFVLLEGRIRRESMARANVGGHELVVHAFQPENGKIPVGLDQSEKLGVFNLFQGAFQAFRNPATHRPDLDEASRTEALGQLSLVNLLLDLTRKGKEQFERGIG